MVKGTYSKAQYERDLILAVINPAAVDRMPAQDKIGYLKNYGYHNLKGGIEGITVKEFSLVEIEGFLEFGDRLTSRLLIENPSITRSKLYALKEEGMRKLASRVNQVFLRAYKSAREKVQEYEVQKAKPTTEPEVQPSELEVKAEQQTMFDVRETEDSHLDEKGRRAQP